jgi:hypothetical protein
MASWVQPWDGGSESVYGLPERTAQTYHVRTLGNDSDTCGDESLGFLLGDLVLGGAGQGDISLLHEQPRTLAWMETH